MRNREAELESLLEVEVDRSNDLKRDLEQAMDRISELEFALRGIRKDVEGIL